MQALFAGSATTPPEWAKLKTGHPEIVIRRNPKLSFSGTGKVCPKRSKCKMTSEADEIITLEDRRLSAGAAEIKRTFTSEDKAAIKTAQAVPPAEMQMNLHQYKLAPRDGELAAMVAAVEKSGVGEAQKTDFLKILKTRWDQYDLRWLKDLRKAVKSVLGESERALNKGVLRNVIDQDGFPELVTYGLTQLRDQNRDLPDLFRYGSEVAEVVPVEEEGRTTIRTLDYKTFKARLNKCALWRKQVGESGYKHVSVPNDVAEQIFAENNLPLPYLAGKVAAPVFRPSGGLLSMPGYDKETGLYYHPPESLAGLSVPERVTEADVAWAREQMVDLFCDFEMDGVSRADLEAAALHGEGEVPPSFLAAVGWMIEQSVRPIFGAEPLMPLLISKTAPGAGGGLLAKVMQTVIEGKTSSRPLAKGEEEIRKAAFTALLGGHMTIFWDNLPAGKAVDSSVLASLFTEPTFTDRVLGRSQERHLPVRSSFLFVGNRPLFSDELRRRLNLCELVPQVANPEERTGWKHPNLLRHVTKNRADYLRAVLILIKNWIQRGKPEPEHAPVIGSYEAYSEIIPGILEAASPHWTTWGQNRDMLNEIASNDEEDEMSAVLDCWAVEFGIGTYVETSALIEVIKRKEIVLQLRKKNHADSDFDYCGRAMGKLLSSINGRIFELQDGTTVKLLRHDKRGGSGYPWYLEGVEQQPRQRKTSGRRTRPAEPPTAAPSKPAEPVSQEPAKPAPQKTGKVINRRKRGDWAKPKQDSSFDQFDQKASNPFGK